MTRTNLTVTFLGTGSAVSPDGRQQASLALQHEKGTIIFDCGEGTQYSIRKYKISTKKELLICISHLHSDHFLGLPGLLASLQLLDRKNLITIIGPPGTIILIQNLITANFIKVQYEMKIIEFKQGDVFEGKGYVITAINAIHEARALSFIWKELDRPGKVNIQKLEVLGIPSGPLIGRLQRGENVVWQNKEILSSDIIGPPRLGRKVIYSGDTSPNPNLVKVSKMADILIHEASYPSEMEELALERGHSTVPQAVQIAKDANVELLVLTHFSPRIIDWEKETTQALELFPKTKFAFRGLKLDVPFQEN